MTSKINKNVVVIGGGTGTSLLLRELKKYPLQLSAVITTSDSGGSSGKLRKEIGMAPPGDARQCFVALNDENHPVISHFNTRFSGGNLKGHTFGNLFLALLWQHHDDFQKAIEEAEKMFGSKHFVVPVTTGPSNLVAELKNGDVVEGETNIIKINGLNKKLKKLQLLPIENINPKAKKVIREADIIIIGPGNLYASLTPPLLVKGVRETILGSGAKKVYVANLMNQIKLTKDFTIHDYLKHFKKILGKDIFDSVIYNTKNIDKKILHKFNILDQPLVVKNDEIEDRYIGANLVDTNISEQDINDPLKRTYIRHDSKKIAQTINEIMEGRVA